MNPDKAPATSRITNDLTEEDLELILDGRNLIEMLIEKYEKVRLDL